MDNCRKEIDPLNPENKQLNNLFNKCICYDFFHNSIRNKIRYILREITKEFQPIPTNNPKNSIKNNEKKNDNPSENKIYKAGSFPIVNKKEKDNYEILDQANENLKRQTTSNSENKANFSRKNSGNKYYLETQDEMFSKNSDLSRKFELKNLKSKLKENLKTARKERILTLFTEGSTERKENNSFLRSNSQKCKQINNSGNKNNLKNYFNSSDKKFNNNINSNYDLDQNLVKNFENNDNLKNNKVDIKSNENSKGFSNNNSTGDSTNFFNKKNTNYTTSNGKLPTSDTNKFLSNNSNGMCEFNKFNNNTSGNLQQMIVLTEINSNNNPNNYEDSKENLNLNFLRNLNSGRNKSPQKAFDSELLVGNISATNNNYNAKVLIGDKNNNNISNNPNISIFNNFIYSFNKKEKNSNFIQSKNNNSTYVTSEKLKSSSNIQSTSQNEHNINENNHSNKITKTEGNLNSYQIFKSEEPLYKKLDTQENIETTTVEFEKNVKNKINIDPNKILIANNRNNFKTKSYDFPKQYFSIGYILIIIVCKSIRLKIFEYIDNFSLSNLEEVKNYNLKKCCLYHFLISLEDGIKINKKFSIENFFKNYSSEFKNFICNITTISLSNRQKTRKKCLQGNLIYNLNAIGLLEHPWIKSEKMIIKKMTNNNNLCNIKISLREVLKIVRESFKTSLVEFNEKKYENLSNKLEVILNNHKDYLKEENIRNAMENRQDIIKTISYDIGLNFQEFYEKICALVNKIFLKKE